MTKKEYNWNRQYYIECHLTSFRFNIDITLLMAMSISAVSNVYQSPKQHGHVQLKGLLKVSLILV